jgi:hypothetical protein
MLLKWILVASVGFTFIGCVSSERGTQMSADITMVNQRYRADVEGRACINEFKSTMNDPSSFELSGPLTYDAIYTKAWYGIGWDDGNPRRVVYSAPIRGRNAYGGLVRGEMFCHFGINRDGTLSLVRTS